MFPLRADKYVLTDRLQLKTTKPEQKVTLILLELKINLKEGGKVIISKLNKTKFTNRLAQSVWQI